MYFSVGGKVYFWFLFELQRCSWSPVLGVFREKGVSLRNYHYQVMDILAVEMWQKWEDTFQRIEDGLDL